jgi:cytochrome c-type biogenesis protein CcmE
MILRDCAYFAYLYDYEKVYGCVGKSKKPKGKGEQNKHIRIGGMVQRNWEIDSRDEGG